MSDGLRIRSGKQHIESLLQAFDLIIFVELAISQYLDNLTLLLVRAFVQFAYVQRHKLPGGHETTTQIVPVIIVNAICIITHILHAAPEAANKASHGYMHGGAILDLIGERPCSKWRLIGQDLLIFGLQLLMLAVGHEQTAEQDRKRGTTTTQDLDAEEAGMRRSQEGATAAPVEEPTEPRGSEGGIEMQSFLPATEGAVTTAVDSDDDLILTLNVRRSLKGLITRNSQRPPAEDGEGSSAIDSAAERVDALRLLLQRVAGSRG
ncbi:uncharacterized protein AB675_8904 [Cyphellophora attinorum]|uniref:DUF1746 domain-containing protein n=1 Tax=Cyphellophora attinorum TaxID=1664694 RepID=A0A0N1H5F0_9EURO|nr:uncharacterized protein AB675_8904 [Phialophora attinorum]KPI36217.1 hypothetical protein AB675_8904 [Phialophora attinorum]